MAFVRKQGKTKLIWLPVKTSTALSKDSLVAWETGGTGLLVAATATTEPNVTVGVLRHAIASTDADYATARLVEVEVPVENWVTWTADVTSGLVAADISTFCDLTDASTVNRAASSLDVAICVGVISSTKGVFVLNAGPAGFGKVGVA